MYASVCLPNLNFYNIYFQKAEKFRAERIVTFISDIQLMAHIQWKYPSLIDNAGLYYQMC